MLLWGQRGVEKHRKFRCIPRAHAQRIDFFTTIISANFHRLLDILAGRKNKSGLTGRVLVNGQPQPSNFKCISGYVVQVNLIKINTLLIQIVAVPRCNSSLV